jgi:hypothetical protein
MLGAKKLAESAFLALSGGYEVGFRVESAETALKVEGLEFLCMLGAEIRSILPFNQPMLAHSLSF